MVGAAAVVTAAVVHVPHVGAALMGVANRPVVAMAGVVGAVPGGVVPDAVMAAHFVMVTPIATITTVVMAVSVRT